MSHKPTSKDKNDSKPQQTSPMAAKSTEDMAHCYMKLPKADTHITKLDRICATALCR